MSTVRAGRWAALFAVAVVGACGEGEQGICPQCRPTAGGETSDFSTDGCVDAEEQPLTSELAQSLGVEEVRARVEGPFEATLRWTVDPEFLRDPRGGSFRAPPSGFEASTTIEGSISLGEPAFFAGRRIDPSSTFACPDSVQFTADVMFATADGALRVPAASGRLRIIEGRPMPPVLFAPVDLSQVDGRLDLHVAESGLEGLLRVFVYAFPEGLRGLLIPEVDGESVISAQWPDDGCGPAAFPIDADQAHEWLEGKTPRDLEQEWRSAIAAEEPTLGRWLDGAGVQVSAVLGAIDHICLDNEDGSPMLFFESESRLTTSDGRVNAELGVGFFMPDTLGLSSRHSANAPELRPDEFEQLTGIAGIDAFGSPSLSAFIETQYVRTERGIDASGALWVEGFPRCARPDAPCAVDPQELGAHIDCLSWPPPLEFPEICGRHLR